MLTADSWTLSNVLESLGMQPPPGHDALDPPKQSVYTVGGARAAATDQCSSYSGVDVHHGLGHLQ